MSITIDWASLTTGPSGLALADSIRDFIHDKFQQVALPRFIRSVHVHTFDFGEECPVVELKDISDPLPEFYEQDEDLSSSVSEEEDGEGDELGEEEAAVGGAIESKTSTTAPKQQRQQRQQPIQPQYRPNNNYSNNIPQQPTTMHPPPAIPTRLPNLHLRSPGLPFPPPSDQISTPFLSRSNATTPGMPIPGGTSNFSYFHLPLSSGSAGLRSGTQTPLMMPWGEQQQSQQRPPSPMQERDKSKRAQPPLPFSSSYMANPISMPTTRDSSSNIYQQQQHHHPVNTVPEPHHHHHPSLLSNPPTNPPTDRSQDLQITLHISYTGTLSLSLTAEILLDYPSMPSFVGIPLKLQITGLSFDGVALLAYLRHYSGTTGADPNPGADATTPTGADSTAEERRKLHFCFLNRDDARAMLGHDGDDRPKYENRDGATTETGTENKITQESAAPAEEVNDNDNEASLGGLLREIRVESEIGKKEEGKQVLKNVGKVEKFVLEQVRRILEEEFVWPSFWTFLV